MFGLDVIGGLIAGKPDIPEFTPVDSQTEQAKAAGANTANFGAISQSASQVNAFNQSELLKQLKQAIPDYDKLVGQAGDLIESMMSGEVPRDVQDQIQRNSAVKALGGGFGGSGMHGDLTARDLGLTSLQLTQTGLDAATRWMQSQKSLATTGLFDITQMFITPAQQIALAQWNTQNQFQRDYVSNLNDWQHSFGNIVGQSLINTDAQLTNIVSSLAGSAAGMLMGGMGAPKMDWVGSGVRSNTNFVDTPSNFPNVGSLA